MSILKVARLGHPVLRAKARPLDKAEIRGAVVQKLIEDMMETMHEYHGVGLAAPQIHESVRLFVAALDQRPASDAEDRPDEDDPEPIAIINPEITVVGTDVVEDWEGCLSIPDLRGRVPRWRKLRVDALDRKGNTIQITAEGFFARVIQHEFDHLMGKVYLDRMRDFSTLSHLAEFQRFWLPQEDE